MAIHAPITGAPVGASSNIKTSDLIALRIAGMTPFTGDDAIPLVEQAYSLLTVLAAGFQTNDHEVGPTGQSGVIVGYALEGVASLVALARYAIEADEAGK